MIRNLLSYYTFLTFLVLIFLGPRPQNVIFGARWCEMARDGARWRTPKRENALTGLEEVDSATIISKVTLSVAEPVKRE